ncbi:MAG: hypothetical protein ACKO2M_03495, partial [Actinomycetota bacterium]
RRRWSGCTARCEGRTRRPVPAACGGPCPAAPISRADGINWRALTVSIAPATSNSVMAMKRSDGFFFKAINIQPKRVAPADSRARISPSSRVEISQLLHYLLNLPSFKPTASRILLNVAIMTA